MTRGSWQKRTLVGGLALGVGLAFGPAAQPAVAADPWVVNTADRSSVEVREIWTENRATHEGPMFAEEPLLSAPFAPGELHADAAADGLNGINLARQLVGLPGDITVATGRQADLQRAAVLLQVNGPGGGLGRPDGMDQDFHDRARTAVASSNRAWGFRSIVDVNRYLLADANGDNVRNVGHRRWMLNPTMQQTAFGFAGTTGATWVLDTARTEKVDYDILAFPAPGAFPVDYLKPAGSTRATVPWHVSLNPDRYDWDATGHTVTLKRLSDGREWTFGADDADPRGEFFAANFQRFGVANAFIFRPDPSTIDFAAGDTFEVTLAGGIYEEGTRTPTTVTYRTTLMALQPFSDHHPGDEHFAAVAWLADEKISTGYGDGTFRPTSSVNRDAMAAFLYRVAGEPDYTPPPTPTFTDVPVGTQFYKEIEWLASTGITTGWEDGTFRPLNEINRDAMAAFLYRLAGEPYFNPVRQSFSDVAPGVKFRKEMEWLADMGISEGWAVVDTREFRPLTPVNRDAMGAFLFRFVDKLGTPTP
ncbi:MAG: S-layer homology domain-containing protein [Propionibacteriaceae bacterium]|nr:S-layer homology domain-containing protein [Propionibacteriaceae bacterium]